MSCQTYWWIKWNTHLRRTLTDFILEYLFNSKCERLVRHFWDSQYISQEEAAIFLIMVRQSPGYYHLNLQCLHNAWNVLVRGITTNIHNTLTDWLTNWVWQFFPQQSDQIFASTSQKQKIMVKSHEHTWLFRNHQVSINCRVLQC